MRARKSTPGDSLLLLLTALPLHEGGAGALPQAGWGAVNEHCARPRLMSIPGSAQTRSINKARIQYQSLAYSLALPDMNLTASGYSCESACHFPAAQLVPGAVQETLSLSLSLCGSFLALFLSSFFLSLPEPNPSKPKTYANKKHAERLYPTRLWCEGFSFSKFLLLAQSVKRLSDKIATSRLHKCVKATTVTRITNLGAPGLGGTAESAASSQCQAALLSRGICSRSRHRGSPRGIRKVAGSYTATSLCTTHFVAQTVLWTGGGQSLKSCCAKTCPHTHTHTHTHTR